MDFEIQEIFQKEKIVLIPITKPPFLRPYS